jgi:hypothetical protein
LSDLWLIPLGVGAGGAVLLALAVRRLNARLAELKDSMRPLRVDAQRARRGPGAGTL